VFPGRHVDCENLLDLAQQEGVTLSGAVPTVWLAAVQAMEEAPSRWNFHHAQQPSAGTRKGSGLRVVIAGSAPPESLIRRLEAQGIGVIHAWGLTETTPIATVNYPKQHLRDLSPDQHFRLSSKQGLPTPFVEMRIVG